MSWYITLILVTLGYFLLAIIIRYSKYEGYNEFYLSLMYPLEIIILIMLFFQTLITIIKRRFIISLIFLVCACYLALHIYNFHINL
jgi:hypothetical protein